MAPNARAQAAQQHPQIVAQFGGAVEGPLASYVSSVGERTADTAGPTRDDGNFSLELLHAATLRERARAARDGRRAAEGQPMALP